MEVVRGSGSGDPGAVGIRGGSRGGGWGEQRGVVGARLSSSRAARPAAAVDAAGGHHATHTSPNCPNRPNRKRLATTNPTGRPTARWATRCASSGRMPRWRRACATYGRTRTTPSSPPRSRCAARGLTLEGGDAPLPTAARACTTRRRGGAWRKGAAQLAVQCTTTLFAQH